MLVRDVTEWLKYSRCAVGCRNLRGASSMILNEAGTFLFPNYATLQQSSRWETLMSPPTFPLSKEI